MDRYVYDEYSSSLQNLYYLPYYGYEHIAIFLITILGRFVYPGISESTTPTTALWITIRARGPAGIDFNKNKKI